jgi:hypothetical protein
MGTVSVVPLSLLSATFPTLLRLSGSSLTLQGLYIFVSWEEQHAPS